MRKEFTLLIAAMAAMSSQAITVTETAVTAENTMEVPSCLHNSFAKKAPMAAPADWKFNVSADDIIYDRPAGVEKMYSKACEYYSSTIFGAAKASSNGMPCTVVEDDKGNFYIYNPFSAIDTKTWLKATIEGDKMTVKLPQAIYSDSDGETQYVYVAQMCHFEWEDDSHDSGRYYAEEGDTQITFNKEGDVWVMQPTEEVNEHPMVMGLVAADDATWCIYSDWNITLTPFNDVSVTPPAGVDIKTWDMVYPIDGSYIFGKYINVGIDGEDIYLNGISDTFPEGWIKGKIADNKITFPSEQYMGANEMSNAFGFFYAMKEEKEYNEEWEFWMTNYVPIESLIFEKDSQTGKYATENTLTVVNGKNGTQLINSYSAPRISPQEEVKVFTPANPVIEYYSAASDWAGSLYFRFPVVNTLGQLLNTSNLYYRIFVDDEIFQFYSDEYAGVEDGTEAISYNFSNGDTISRIVDGSHYMSIPFSGYDTIDLQVFYLDGDKEYDSAKVRVAGEEDSVEGIAADATVAAEQWYDLSGRRVVNPERGIYLKRVEYSDGTARTFKTMVR